MRRYLIHLIILTLATVVVSFVLLWTTPQLFIAAMPLIALYFAIVTGIQHYLIVRALHKDPRRFVKVFLSVTTTTLIIHIVVMSLYMLSHLQSARIFALAFAICYLLFFAFEIVELVRYVDNYHKQMKK